MRFLARVKKRARRKLVVFARRDHSRWSEIADFVTADKAVFLRLLGQNKKLLGVVDDAGATIGRTDPEMEAAFAESRHDGHALFALAQAATMINPQVRRNCNMLRTFKQSPGDCDLLAEGFIHPELKQAWMLDEYEYLECRKGFGEVYIGLKDGSVKLLKGELHARRKNKGAAQLSWA